ncbi:MAG: PA2778 family cysteine peptidase [Sterolibacterium sp.]|nr:PA2778 family cysteine peptidase [Sterolibacterium sp.]
MGLRNAWPAGVANQVELVGVPFFPQQDYQCGPAALATTLVYSGAKITPENLVGQVYLPARQGSLQVDMQAAPRRYGMVSYRLAPRFDDLLREVAAGNPVIVLQNNGIWPIVKWHYAVVAGFDYPAGELLLRSGESQRLAVPFTIFEYTWKKSDYWAMVTLPPDRIPATATESSYLAAIVAMARVADINAVTLAYTTFLKRWPDNLTASIALANHYYERGALKEAEAVLRQAAVHHPDSVVVLNNLAQTVSDQEKQDEALALIDRALRMEGPFAAVARETRVMILQRMAKSR